MRIAGVLCGLLAANAALAPPKNVEVVGEEAARPIKRISIIGTRNHERTRDVDRAQRNDDVMDDSFNGLERKDDDAEGEKSADDGVLQQENDAIDDPLVFFHEALAEVDLALMESKHDIDGIIDETLVDANEESVEDVHDEMTVNVEQEKLDDAADVDDERYLNEHGETIEYAEIDSDASSHERKEEKLDNNNYDTKTPEKPDKSRGVPIQVHLLPPKEVALQEDYELEEFYSQTDHLGDFNQLDVKSSANPDVEDWQQTMKLHVHEYMTAAAAMSTSFLEMANASLSQVIETLSDVYDVVYAFLLVRGSYAYEALLDIWIWTQNLLETNQDAKVIVKNVWGTALLSVFAAAFISIYCVLRHVPSVILDYYRTLDDFSKVKVKLTIVFCTIVSLIVLKAEWWFWASVILFTLFYYWSGNETKTKRILSKTPPIRRLHSI